MNKARKIIPNNLSIWTTAIRLEETNAKTKEMNEDNWDFKTETIKRLKETGHPDELVGFWAECLEDAKNLANKIEDHFLSAPREDEDNKDLNKIITDDMRRVHELTTACASLIFSTSGMIAGKTHGVLNVMMEEKAKHDPLAEMMGMVLKKSMDGLNQHAIEKVTKGYMLAYDAQMKEVAGAWDEHKEEHQAEAD